MKRLPAGDRANFITHYITKRNQRIPFGNFILWGMMKVNHEHMKRLYLELASLEDRGITIWLEGTQSNPENVANQLCVHEESTYMRDYIFDEGVLKEVHFDKVNKESS